MYRQIAHQIASSQLGDTLGSVRVSCGLVLDLAERLDAATRLSGFLDIPTAGWARAHARGSAADRCLATNREDALHRGSDLAGHQMAGRVVQDRGHAAIAMSRTRSPTMPHPVGREGR